MTEQTTPEQAARNMLERMGIDDAQSMTSGDVVELANLITAYEQAKGALADIAGMSSREITDGVAQRKARRIYDKVNTLCSDESLYPDA
jgi:hypothetical protein